MTPKVKSEKTYLGRIIYDLNLNIKLELELIEKSSILKHQKDPEGVFIMIQPPYYWAKKEQSNLKIQMELKDRFIKFIAQINSLFVNAPDYIISQINEINDFILSWIDQKESYEIPGTIEAAKAVFLEKVNPLFSILDSLNMSSSTRNLLVPDTNVLIDFPDILKYNDIFKIRNSIIVLIPTVLSELDDLKRKRNDINLVNKVKESISTIKKLRNKGNFLDGINVTKSIKLMTIVEVSSKNSPLSILESENKDDKILTSVLEIQRKYPTDCVYLLTSDIHLQTKAESLSISFLEPLEKGI